MPDEKCKHIIDDKYPGILLVTKDCPVGQNFNAAKNWVSKDKCKYCPYRASEKGR